MSELTTDDHTTTTADQARDWRRVADASTAAALRRIRRIAGAFHDVCTVAVRAHIEYERAVRLGIDCPAPVDARLALRTAVVDLLGQLDVAAREAADDARDNDGEDDSEA